MIYGSLDHSIAIGTGLIHGAPSVVSLQAHRALGTICNDGLVARNPRYCCSRR